MDFKTDMEGIFGGLGAGLMGSMYQNPSDAASPYLNQIMPLLKQYLGPYATAGSNMLPTLTGNYSKMTDPDFINTIGKGFQQNPGYQFQMDQMMRAANNAAGAGGMTGTPAALQQSMGVAQQLANSSYMDWLQKALGEYNAGAQGEQSIYNVGGNAANNLASGLTSGLVSQANNAYQGANAQNNMMGGLFKAGMQALPFIMDL